MIILYLLLWCLLAETVIFFLQGFFKTHSLIDIFWGLNPILIGIYFLITSFSIPLLVLFTAITFWGLRLSLFLYMTRFRQRHQDSRYIILQRDRGFYSLNLLKGLYIQAFLQVLLLVIYIPFLTTTAYASFSLMQLIFLMMFAIFLGFEHLADYELLTFKRSKHKGLCHVGLWSLCRHPNLLFECCIWASLSALVFSFTFQWYAILPFLCVFITIRYITAPFAEKDMLNRYKDAYIAYQKSTPMINPFKRKTREN